MESLDAGKGVASVSPAVDSARKLPRKPRSYQKTGVHTLKRAVQTLGNRALPTKRTALGRELAAWRTSLVADLGGAQHVSTQQLALVDVAVRTKLMLDSVDAYVLTLDALVNKRKRCLWPVVRERQALAGQLQGVLRDLGLERRHGDEDVATILAKLHAADPSPQERQGSQRRQLSQDTSVGDVDPTPS